MTCCPKCGSNKIRRSQRRGIVEGLFLRLVFRAPFRCIACGARFVGPYHARQFQRPQGRRSLLSFLGFQDSQRDKLQQTLVMIGVAAVAIVAVVLLILRLLKPHP
jgi:hypothetical protein